MSCQDVIILQPICFRVKKITTFKCKCEQKQLFLKSHKNGLDPSIVRFLLWQKVSYKAFLLRKKVSGWEGVWGVKTSMPSKNLFLYSPSVNGTSFFLFYLLFNLDCQSLSISPTSAFSHCLTAKLERDQHKRADSIKYLPLK